MDEDKVEGPTVLERLIERGKELEAELRMAGQKVKAIQNELFRVNRLIEKSKTGGGQQIVFRW